MPNNSPDPQWRRRDGTSQASRLQAALDPEYVRVDERSYKDLLAFARKYAEELRYYNADNQPMGDWSTFLAPALDLDEVVAFMHDPTQVRPETAARCARPHVVLFLTFLHLLRHAQDHLNTLTRRHLDFYYRQVLHMTSKPGIPDRVNVLVDVAEDTEGVELAAGTLLHAGTDSLGQDLCYRTDRTLVANRAQVARLSSVYVARRLTGIRAAREARTGRPEEAFMRMLQIALGDPLPGDPLPPYPLAGGERQEMNADLLQKLHSLVRVGQEAIQIQMPFDDFLKRMRLEPERDTLKQELATVDFSKVGIGQVDEYCKALLDLEAYFNMFADDFSFIMSIQALHPSTTGAEWDPVYEKLENAYRNKVSKTRRAELEKYKDSTKVDAMITLALGDYRTTRRDASPLDTLRRFIKDIEDVQYLEKVSGGKVTPIDWERVYRIVEAAWRSREGRAPVAQTEAWQNLYPAEDATAVCAPRHIEGETPQPHWKTFGQVPPAVRQDSPPPAVLGWAISSPLLALSEGQRRITLTLGFQPEQFHLNQAELDKQPFHIQISTAKGWIEPSALEVKIDDYQALSGMEGPGGKPLQALQCALTVEATVEALAALPREEGQIDSPWPVLRLMLRQIWQPPDNLEDATGRYITNYQIYKDLVLVSTHLQVQVVGLTTLQMQNDETVLPAHKPFEPFGTSPTVGSRFSFGHPEVVRNKLDSLTFTIEWMGVPQNIAAHYTNYAGFAKPPDNSIFTVRVSLVDKRRDMHIIDKAPLFQSPDATKTQTISLSLSTANDYERRPEMGIGDDPQTWDRYLQWEINAPDFQHGAYPIVAAQKSLELAAAIVNKQANTSSDDTQADTSIKAEAYQVNPPYTPKIKRLSLAYAASVDIRLEAYRPGVQPDRLFHMHPFGYHEMQPDTRTQQYRFFPQYDNEGELYIGLQDVRPPQNLTLLFLLAEGSADPDLTPVPVQWHYLSGNRWLNLDEGNVLQDTTRGLINTGIIEFALAPAQPSTLLPEHLYWLRATIPQHSTSVCDTVAIHTQAVSATFVDQTNAPEHLSRPLPAGSITNLAEPLPEITGIRQPYTSYGGKVAEQDSHLYTRVSERLRHKHRALTIWDYEHMILERFPEVYKAKCLPADPTAHPDDPGRVEIVVIPDIRNELPFNPFEPKAPADLLADIAAYLADYSPAWATVHVKNAQYVPVKVRFAVRFHPGYNEGFYQQYMNDELNRFLSPWAYEEGAEIEIGGRIYANVIINFLEERSYVDYVANITLFSSEDHGKTFRPVLPSADEGYWVQTDRPDGILVAAQQHEIDLIAGAGYEEQVFTGINYMKIDLDFIVGGN